MVKTNSQIALRTNSYVRGECTEEKLGGFLWGGSGGGRGGSFSGLILSPILNSSRFIETSKNVLV